MAKQVLTNLDFNNNSRIINLPAGTDPNHPVTLSQLNSAIEGLAWKDSAKVATASNINLSSPGGTIDGITMTVSDRVLVRSQTLPAENGIYIWNGATTAMTRSLDASTDEELEQATISVEEGTSANSTFRQTALNFVLGTGAIAFAAFGTVAPAATETTAGISEIATQAETDAGIDDSRTVTPAKLANWSGRPRRFATNIGDGTATQFTVTHNFNTRDVNTNVYRNSGSYDEVIVDIENTTVNTVTIRFGSAPSAGAFRVVVTV